MSETLTKKTIFGEEPVTEEHGFYRSGNHTIMSGHVERWEEDLSDRRDCLTVSASRDGVMVQGYSRHIRDVTNLKAVLDVAEAEYHRLKACNGRP